MLHEESGAVTLVGHDGIAFVEGLRAENRLRVEEGDEACTVKFAYAQDERDARVCLNLGGRTASSSHAPRNLANGTNMMWFNLYRDAARSQISGSIYSTAAPAPITLVLSKPLAGTTASASVPYYGRIEANQPGVPIIGNNPTPYTNNFSGTHTALNVHFYDLIDRSCSQIPQASSFSFTAQATVIDDCTISATNLDFPRTGLLDEPLRAAGGLNVRCTNGNAWRLSLNGGGSGSVADRRMQRVGGGGGERQRKGFHGGSR